MIKSKFLRRIAKRIKLPDTRAGKLIQAVGGLVGIGGATAVVIESEIFGGFTGDTVVDVAIVIAVAIMTIYTGKLPVPPECEKDLAD